MRCKSARLPITVAAILLLFSGLSMARASTIALSDLLDGGSVIVGDKLFDDFTYGATGDMPEALNVNVVPIVDAAGNFGLRFQGAFVDLFGAGGSDALITYRVATTLPQHLISDVHLAGNPVVLGPEGSESGMIGVTETFLPDDPLTVLSIFNIEPGSTKPSDFAFLTTPAKTLRIQKDVLAIANAEGNSATLSFIDQTFSQITIPEPSTMSLLILGLVAMWGLRRKSYCRPS